MPVADKPRRRIELKHPYPPRDIEAAISFRHQRSDAVPELLRTVTCWYRIGPDPPPRDQRPGHDPVRFLSVPHVEDAAVVIDRHMPIHDGNRTVIVVNHVPARYGVDLDHKLGSQGAAASRRDDRRGWRYTDHGHETLAPKCAVLPPQPEYSQIVSSPQPSIEPDELSIGHVSHSVSSPDDRGQVHTGLCNNRHFSRGIRAISFVLGMTTAPPPVAASPPRVYL